MPAYKEGNWEEQKFLTLQAKNPPKKRPDFKKGRNVPG